MPPTPDAAVVLAAAEVVHGLGLGTDAVRTALEAGREAFTEARDLAARFRPGTLAVPCSIPDARPFLSSPKLRKFMSEDSLLAVVAARLALERAGLRPGPGRPVADDRFAAYVAVGLAATGWRELVPVFRESLDDQGRLSLRLLGERGLRRCNPLFAFQTLANMALSFISLEQQIRGDNLALAPWEAAGAAALFEARDVLRRGEADAALAVGASAMAGPQGVFWLARAGLLVPPGERPRPGAPAGRGLAPADGAAALVLEPLAAARRRGASPLAALAGAAREHDPTPDSAPCRDAALLERIVHAALDEAGLAPHGVRLVLRSATGCGDADDAEARALDAVVAGGARVLLPATHLGTLFAAAPATAVALAAHALATTPGSGPALVCAFGPGGGPAAFVLREVPA